MEENKTIAEVAPEATPAVEETKKVVLNASVAPEEFDWDAFESDDVYGASVEEIAEQYNQTLSKVVEGEVVEGVVTSISKREVIVNIGYKSEGVIMAPEFRYNPELTVGDKVEVFVESTEDRKGQLILSHKKARQLRSWDMERCIQCRRDRKGLREDTYKGRYDRGRIRNRGLPSRFTDRHQAYPRLRSVC